MKITLIILGIVLTPIIIGGYSIGLFKVFAPVQEDIRREVFENTKSYLHGVQQDLGKYYSEYQGADIEEKNAIQSVIRARFPSVDSDKLQSPVLRQFLRNTRGY